VRCLVSEAPLHGVLPLCKSSSCKSYFLSFRPPTFDGLLPPSSCRSGAPCSLYRGTSLIRKCPPARIAVWPDAQSYRRDLGGSVFQWARYPCMPLPVPSCVVMRGGTVCETSCTRRSARGCRGTSLIRNTLPVGPYSSPIPRDLW